MKSDLELISAFRRGDDAAYITLIRRYHVGVLNFISALTRKSSVAEDLTQTVFLLVLRELHPRRPDVAIPNVPQLPPPPFVSSEAQHGEGSGRVALYIYRATYACWTAYQQRRTSASASGSSVTVNHSASALVTNALQTDGPAGSATPESVYAALPAALRPVLALKEVCGLNYNQIAGVLLLPAPEVAERVRAAYVFLRDALAEQARPNSTQQKALPAPELPLQLPGGHTSGSAGNS